MWTALNLLLPRVQKIKCLVAVKVQYCGNVVFNTTFLISLPITLLEILPKKASWQAPALFVYFFMAPGLWKHFERCLQSILKILNRRASKFSLPITAILPITRPQISPTSSLAIPRYGRLVYIQSSLSHKASQTEG